MSPTNVKGWKNLLAVQMPSLHWHAKNELLSTVYGHTKDITLPLQDFPSPASSDLGPQVFGSIDYTAGQRWHYAIPQSDFTAALSYTRKWFCPQH